MNRFAVISQVEYERQEKEKQGLQKVLQDQIDQKKARLKEQREKELADEQRFEAKLARDREEMAERERQEREEADNKIKRARQQNQALINQKKVAEPAAAPDTGRIHKDAIIRVDEK